MSVQNSVISSSEVVYLKTPCVKCVLSSPPYLKEDTQLCVLLVGLYPFTPPLTGERWTPTPHNGSLRPLTPNGSWTGSWSVT